MGISQLKGAEVASIQSIIQQVENNNSRKPLKTKLRLQVISIVGALGVLGMDLLGGGSVSGILRLAQYDPSIVVVIAGFMFAVLGVLIVSSFFVLKEQAKKEEMAVQDYISRFKVLRRGAIVSDLILQFLFISALIYLGKGVWVPSLLILFTGHFIMQNYIFNFSQKHTLLLTGACYLAGALCFYIGVQSLIPALAIYISVNAFSIFVTSWQAR